jgi:type 1 fimbria pilin
MREIQVKKMILSVAAVALLAGCSSNEADADGDGNISADEVAKVMNEVTLEPGEWENTVEIVDVKIEGLPEGAPANMMDSLKTTTVSKTCITEEQAKNPGAEFFSAQKEFDCEVKKFNMSGGAIDSEMSCTNMNQGAGQMTMAMTGQYGPSSYDMTLSMDGGAAGVNMKITAKNSGKRIGACTAG